MDLNFKTFGQGEPLVILHGLFGMLDNWQTLGKVWAQTNSVYLVDQRNHGRSPHLPEIDYQIMAADLDSFLQDNWIHKTHLLGHSMGGKTAMQFATHYPDMVDKLIIIDIAPKAYKGGHQLIFEALLSIDPSTIDSRQEAEEMLKSKVPEFGVRQFLLKNFSRNKAGGYQWKMNLAALHKHYEEILAPVEFDQVFEGPCLFVRGGESNYIQDNDMEAIHEFFPKAQLKTVANAGHWVHAENPKELDGIIQAFLAQ